MKTFIKHLGWFSLLLTLPALVFCTTGLLRLAFGLSRANEALEDLLKWPLGKLLLSPVAVFGGLVLVIAWHVLRACRLTADVYDGQFTVAASLKLVRSHLVPLGLALLLMVLLLTYALIENFRLVAR
jgi:hypothetical protein